MRILKFSVDGQIIDKNEMCDFSNVVRGTSGYLRAEFSFSPEWNGCVKVAGFYSIYGEEFKPQVLDANNGCLIPAEALKRESFVIRVFGKKKDYVITTNRFIIKQSGGR